MSGGPVARELTALRDLTMIALDDERLDCVIKPIKRLGVPTSDEVDLSGRERLDKPTTSPQIIGLGEAIRFLFASSDRRRGLR